ncbi:hypothetical protein [Herbaspirillum sp. RV1423]|uniref:hypothetical protein n=1 Tax=Herbaspirillum sp. RV1423 TaxID=1443993 RepID=UPI0004B3DC9D|nr:hypothetical protein [Herbaspirillum sp. RV1423]
MMRCALLIYPLLLLSTTPAWAIFKCEANGQVTYSDIACADGKPLDVYDNRGFSKPEQNLPDKDGTQSRRLENTLAKEEQRRARLRQRAQKDDERRQLAADKRRKKCTLLAQRKKWSEDDQRVADVKSQEKARRKMQRATERYLAECPA